MNPIGHRNTFTFAEIVVAAPWLAAFDPNSRDNDKAVMLQRNTLPDEGTPATDALSLEAAARRQRARYLKAGFARLGAWLRSRRQRALNAAQA